MESSGGVVNPDLVKERQKATFDVQKVTLLLHGAETIKKKNEFIDLILKEKDVTDSFENYHFLTREEKYTDAVKKSALLIKLVKKQNIGFEHWHRLGSLIFPNEAIPIGLHGSMFLPSIRGNCTKEQQDKWLEKAENYEIIGTYAQTELGHGTHVRGLETTATYSPKTDEFVINSPTITSTKFWPGSLGKTANYAMVMARLYSNGQFHGVHPFIVQLRNLKTHQPLPGVIVGDIGPKFGYDTMDNGYLRFDHVRIPRTNMMMKNAEVLKDGTFRKIAQNDKLSYGVMVFVRAMIVMGDGATGLAQAVTIAIRYSCIRRQSELQPGEPEPQIIDYQTQQYRLFPLVATAYAYWFTGQHMAKLYFAFQDQLEKNDLQMLPEIHATSAGLKAFATFGMMHGVEQCRLACGGHGFSQASGIPKIYAHRVAGCTYEGENIVMLLQTARFLVKAYQQARSGTVLSKNVAYMTDDLSKKSTLGPEMTVMSFVNAYRHRAARLVAKACTKLSKAVSEGTNQYDAWNKTSVYLVKAAEAHCHLYVVEVFASQLSLDNCSGDSAVVSVLTDLFRLYAAYGIMNMSGDFSEDGYMSENQLDVVSDGVLSLLARLRSNVVSLVDAFDFRDHELGSILGRYDGQVYDNLYKWAKRSPLNKNEVHESHKYIQEAVSKSKL